MTTADYLITGAGTVGVNIVRWITSLARQGARRYFKRWFVQVAQAIMPRIEPEHLQSTNKVGIFVQMFNKQKGKLEHGFLIEQGKNSTHVCNAIFPAWTSAFRFARRICVHHFPYPRFNCKEFQ